MRDLRVIGPNHQPAPVKADRHLRRRITGLKRSDLLVRNTIEDQDLVRILAKDKEAVPRGIGEHIDQVPADVHRTAALIGFAIVDQQAHGRRHVERRGGANGETSGDRAPRVGIGIGIDRNPNDRRCGA